MKKLLLFCVFLSALLPNLHAATPPPAAPEKVYCPYCSRPPFEGNSRKYNWKAHILSIHFGIWFRCSCCRLGYESPGTFNAHLNRVAACKASLPHVNLRSSIKVACPCCLKGASSSVAWGELYYHLQDVHTEEERYKGILPKSVDIPSEQQLPLPLPQELPLSFAASLPLVPVPERMPTPSCLSDSLPPLTPPLSKRRQWAVPPAELASQTFQTSLPFNFSFNGSKTLASAPLAQPLWTDASDQLPTKPLLPEATLPVENNDNMDKWFGLNPEFTDAAVEEALGIVLSQHKSSCNDPDKDSKPTRETQCDKRFRKDTEETE